MWQSSVHLPLQVTQSGFGPWRRKCIQLRWKQCSPRAAARLHLDNSLSKRQACSLHCPDSYLCNCLPVREELAIALPATHSKTETCSDEDSGVLGALSSLPREMWVPLCQLDLRSRSKCCLWRGLQVYWHVSQVQVLSVQNTGAQAKSASAIVCEISVASLVSTMVRLKTDIYSQTTNSCTHCLRRLACQNRYYF